MDEEEISSADQWDYHDSMDQADREDDAKIAAQIRQLDPFHNKPSDFQGTCLDSSFEEGDVFWRVEAFEYQKKGDDFMAEDMREDIEPLEEG